jgi:hypothetical protein
MFSDGGFQGAEGVVEGEGWYIENVLEELDMEREWYFDETTYGARFPTKIYTRGCHWIPRMFA